MRYTASPVASARPLSSQDSIARGSTFSRRALASTRTQAGSERTKASITEESRRALVSTSSGFKVSVSASLRQASSAGGSTRSRSSFDRYEGERSARRAHSRKESPVSSLRAFSQGPKEGLRMRPPVKSNVSDLANVTPGLRVRPKPLEVSRKALFVFYAVFSATRRGRTRGVTYAGLRRLLGTQSDSGTRQAVRAAKAAELVTVTHLPDGRGGKAVIRCRPEAIDLFRELGLLEPAKGRAP